MKRKRKLEMKWKKYYRESSQWLDDIANDLREKAFNHIKER